MTAAQFNAFWHATYPETGPISHLFRHAYPARWFRIHSLPELQRYATTAADWRILFNRQNYLLTDLLGTNKEVLLVTGAYEFATATLPADDEPIGKLTDLEFTLSERLDLHEVDPENHQSGEYYQPMFSEQRWQFERFRPLLKEIANFQTKAFFVSQRNACLVAPYDGGVDVVLKDEATRDFCRRVYQAWLSPLPSGL
jgi:hypothetical protein